MSAKARRVRFVSTSVALTYDSKHDTVIKVVRYIDDRGRAWEQYGEGPCIQIACPEEPDSDARSARWFR